ncbi:MAG: hypothetical protein EOO08_03265 [Chitinophagaceae bacterium]|nr:MAG: hypothetical protein EOO08_03265 [Chitinophagaceae bacterium]
MRVLLSFLAVAALSCSKESTLDEMASAQKSTSPETAVTAANTNRTSAASAIDGSWRRIATRYNRGDGMHSWESIPADQQVVVTFVQGKLVPNGHPYLSLFNTYQEPKPGVLRLTNSRNGRTSESLYTISGNTLEITYRQREEVVDRFVKE